MNLQEQIGVLAAGVDQLIQAAAAVQGTRADERAAAEPLQTSPVASSEVEAVSAADAAATALAATPEAEAAASTEAVAVAEAREHAEPIEPVVPVESVVPAEPVEAAETVEAVSAVETAEPAAAGAPPELLVARPTQNEITLTIGGQTVTLNAVQIGQMIEELANARASMQPEPPPGIPPGWRFASTKNPVMAVQKQSNGDRLLVMRHTGHGWVPFTFSPDIVVQMYMMLTQR